MTYGEGFPSLRILEAALHKTTDALVGELTQPTNQPPQWSDLEWRIAEAAAGIHGIGALLAHRLRWRGPDRWQSFLAAQEHHTRLRRHAIHQLLNRIDQALVQAGVAAVGLKGCALYELGVYPADDRPMGDIDLLVAEEDSDRAAGSLASLGYTERFSNERHRIFEPADLRPGPGPIGEHIDNPLKIELHTRIAEPLPVRITDITSLVMPRHPRPGIHSYPSTAALMRHLLLHASCNIRARALRAIQLHDIALLGERMRASDWEELTNVSEDPGHFWWALAPLSLTRRYYPSSIPIRVLAAARRGCPALLRRAARIHTLADVSWSNLRVRAFPGIEWSRSPAEALRFMASRIVPDRESLRLLRKVDERRQYGKASEWYSAPHLRRILRWMFSQPPRVQTIYPIAVALGIERPVTSE